MKTKRTEADDDDDDCSGGNVPVVLAAKIKQYNISSNVVVRGREKITR